MCRPESGCERTNLSRCFEWANDGACEHDREYMLNCCKYACFDECVWDYHGIVFVVSSKKFFLRAMSFYVPSSVVYFTRSVLYSLGRCSAWKFYVWNLV